MGRPRPQRPGSRRIVNRRTRGVEQRQTEQAQNVGTDGEVSHFRGKIQPGIIRRGDEYVLVVPGALSDLQEFPLKAPDEVGGPVQKREKVSVGVLGVPSVAALDG